MMAIFINVKKSFLWQFNEDKNNWALAKVEKCWGGKQQVNKQSIWRSICVKIKLNRKVNSIH
jgi:hypothetical protein